MQEYDFQIMHCKGSLNTNADSLSRLHTSPCAVTLACRHYTPSPIAEAITVPILPTALRQAALQHNHDAPTAGHQGFERTLDRLRQEAYWVSMAKDVEKYCRECTKCQKSKLSMPQCAPLTSLPIGRPWQMIAVDILEVPLSANNNRYLLVHFWPPRNFALRSRLQF